MASLSLKTSFFTDPSKGFANKLFQKSEGLNMNLDLIKVPDSFKGNPQCIVYGFLDYKGKQGSVAIFCSLLPENSEYKTQKYFGRLYWHSEQLDFLIDRAVNEGKEGKQYINCSISFK